MARARVVVRLTPEASAAGAHAGGEPRPATREAAWHGVAVDVLRATSTLTVARGNGAARIVPFATPDAALAYRGAHPDALACGEREGRIVPGFDLGNSPAEYVRERVGGRTLAFASTNGSLALLDRRGCGRRWLGCFLSASALLSELAGAEHVAITCAGKEGAFALEDAACAGWLVRRLAEGGAEPEGDEARLCASLAPRDADEVRALVEGCEHARYLGSLGEPYARDVALCATLDALDRAHEF